MRQRSISTRTDRALPRPLRASDLQKIQGGLGPNELIAHELVHVVQQGRP